MPPTICDLSQAEVFPLSQAADSVTHPPSSVGDQWASTLGDRQARLRAFIQWAVQVSCSGKYGVQDSLHLLERARDARRTLQQLQTHQGSGFEENFG